MLSLLIVGLQAVTLFHQREELPSCAVDSPVRAPQETDQAAQMGGAASNRCHEGVHNEMRPMRATGEKRGKCGSVPMLLVVGSRHAELRSLAATGARVEPSCILRC